MDSLVSIIIPNYNHANYLDQRINSVLNQTFKNVEVIILDDNSTDNSRQVIDRYVADPKVKHIIFNPTNSGSPFIQWAKGIDLAEGEYIWIAESDDYADLTFLEKVMAKIENKPEIAFCYTASNIVEHGEVNDASKTSVYYNQLFNTNRWSGNFENDGKLELINYLGGFCTIINASSCVFRKSAFPVDNKEIYKFKYCGDWLVWIEMCMKGRIIYLNEPLNHFRIHAKSTVNAFSALRKGEEMYWCLLRARFLTSGKSIIPNETLGIVFYMWTYNSIYFFLKNFKLNLLFMHARLDKNLTGKFLLLFKNYYQIKSKKA